MRALLVSALLVFFTAACTVAPSPVATAVAEATLAPSPSPPPVQPTAVPITPSPDYFVGLWKCCTGYELHQADGSYRFEHTLAALLSRETYGHISAEGDVMTYVESSSDCTTDQVGTYKIGIQDADTYRLALIADPCTWRAKTGSAPLDGGVFHRLLPALPYGAYTREITPQDAQAAGAALAPLAGSWELQLHEGGTYDLLQDNRRVDSGRYFDAEKQFLLVASELCAGHGEALGTFKVQLEGQAARFFKQQADCEPLIFVLKTNPWTLH